MSCLLAGDHAFADGGVFPSPSGAIDALRLTGSWRESRLLLKVWKQWARSAVIEPAVKLGLGARLINRDMPQRVTIHSRAMLRGILRNEAGGMIDIGADTYFGDGTLISAAQEVVIGAGTLLAHGVQVFDNDTHPLDAQQRVRHFRMIVGLEPAGPVEVGSAPVRIGQRCWIGMHALIMKGVTLGDETVVAAGSLVVSDFPARVLIGGNPARVIRSL